MAFTFKKNKSVRQTIKRLARKRIRKALRHLEDVERLEAVHDVRKDIKQLRALLRLVRAATRRAECRRCSYSLKKISAQLGEARDSHVKLNALAELTSHFKSELGRGAFGEVKVMLTADCKRQQAALSQGQARRKVGRILRRLAQDRACFRIKRSGWSAIGPGIRSSYRQGRRGCQSAQKDGRAEDFHEWRKRVKDLFYQVGLLRPVWPEQMSAAEAELNHLGKFLGDDHDLFLLSESSAMRRGSNHSGEEAEALQALIDLRQKELRAAAVELGVKFYEEKPSAFCQRLRQYWKRWRASRAQKSPGRSARLR